MSRKKSCVYIVNKYDYDTGKNSVVGVHSEKRNAIFSMEAIAHDFIEKRDGEDVSVTVVKNMTEHAVAKSSKYPVGHYMVVDNQKHIDQISIWEKYTKVKSVSGLFGTSEVKELDVSKIFDLDVVQLPFAMFSAMYKFHKNVFSQDVATPPCSSWGEFSHTYYSSGVADGLRNKENTVSIKVSELKEQFPTEFGSRKWPVPSQKKVPVPVSEDPMFKSIVGELSRVCGDEQDTFDYLSRAD